MGLGTVPKRATGVASGGAGLPVAFFYRVAPGIPTWTRVLESVPWGLWGSPFAAMRLQALYAWQCLDPMHREHLAWATNELLCPVGSVQIGRFLLDTFQLQALTL